MIYIWECYGCSHCTEVNRRVAEIDLEPEAGCEQCGSKQLKRIIRRPDGLKGFVLEGGCWDYDGYRKPAPPKKRSRRQSR